MNTSPYLISHVSKSGTSNQAKGSQHLVTKPRECLLKSVRDGQHGGFPLMARSGHQRTGPTVLSYHLFSSCLLSSLSSKWPTMLRKSILWDMAQFSPNIFRNCPFVSAPINLLNFSGKSQAHMEGTKAERTG